jgi:hypothetical protein
VTADADQLALFGDSPSPDAAALPPGWDYRRDFIDADEEATLLAFIATLPLEEARYKGYTAARRESWTHQPATAPALPQPGELPAFDNTRSLAWVAQYGFRFAEGALSIDQAAPEPPSSARSLFWLQDQQARDLDFLSLLAMSDAFFGRIFQVIGRIPPFGTVSMTTYFHAAADELAAHGSAPLAALADARVFHRSFCDQTAELYGRDGQLLATAVQIAYFRA